MPSASEEQGAVPESELAKHELEPKQVPVAEEAEVPRTKMGSHMAPTPLEGDPGQRTRVQVYTPDDAAELCIVDRTYALVASAVGSLDVMLPAGEYRIRQRVGDEEHIQPLTVTLGGAAQTVDLPLLLFPSPIPLPGTTFGDSAGSDLRQLATAQGNFRLLLWAPTDSMLDGEVAASKARIATEFERLRLEVFQATGPAARSSISWPDITWTERGNALITAELPYGPYVLVQRDELGRQRCLPLWVRPGFVTSVFLLSLQVDGAKVPLQLDHAGIAFLRPADFQRPFESSLYQLEAARKALGLGRRMHGWVWRSHEVLGADEVRNPLLYLIGALLLLSVPKTQLQADVLDYGGKAGENLGDDFPDAVAIRSLISSPEKDPIQAHAAIELKGPPLLRRSWELLLRIPQGNVALGRVMTFPYTVDGTGVWFLWSEDPGGSEVPADDEGVLSVPTSVVVDSLQSWVGLGRVLYFAVTRATLLRGMFANAFGSLGLRKALPSPDLSSVSFDDVVNLLVALVDSGMLQKLLDKGQKLAASKGVRVDDEMLHRLLQSLQVLREKTLVKALTAEVLVREALVSLRLPKEKVVALARSALAGLLTKVDSEDQARALKAMSIVLDVAEAWVNSEMRRDR